MTQGFAPTRKAEEICEAGSNFANRTQPNPTLAHIQNFPLFLGLSTAARSEIISAARERTFSRRQIIFFQGDPLDRVILLVSGSVKTTQFGENGGEVILRLSGPGDLIGANGSDSGRHQHSMAQSLASSRVLVWSANVFETILGRFPALRYNASRILGEHLRDLEKRFCEMSTENVSLRVGHEIARLVDRIGEHVNGAFRIRLSREDLAQLTGTTLFTVSRLLSRWKKYGIVTTGREFVMVHNPQALANLCEME